MNAHVLDMIEERCTGMQRPEEFMRKPGVFQEVERPTGNVRYDTPDRNEEHELVVTVGCRFWANGAQLPRARENAKAILADVLYRDVLVELSEIRHAIYDGARDAALCRLADLEKRLRT